MGKTSKWIKHLFVTSNKNNKKENKPRGSTTENHHSSSLPTTPKEKRRWSFRRAATGAPSEAEEDQRRHAAAVLAATAAAAEAAQAAAKAAAAVVRLTETKRRSGGGGVEEEAAARKIQSVFRGYLARKALNALRGLVKLQALVRGHLVRKQAAATLRCMQALVTVQARARMQRIKINDDYSLNQIIPNNIINDQRHLNYRKSVQDNRFRPTYNEMDRGMEENIKIVEMDYGDSKTNIKGRSSYSNYTPTERTEHHRFSTQSAPNRAYMAKPDQRDISPATSAMSALTEIMSPRACSNHFEDYSFNTAQSSPQYYSAISKPHEYSECGPASFSYHDSPSYMANTESSRAKARSQSAPKSRPDNTSPQFERQPSKRRPSIEGRNVPRAVRMLRSSSHLGPAAQNYHYPWSVKLDKSSVSLKDSECGSTSTVLTNSQYCRSLVGFEVNGKRY